ncbi:AsmA-like C-terminal domain-containing protein [Bremerella cremea]|uniref:AsmA-like C-terminal domain-containing protein n=1 Tax=Bremerella cremea TaxID=1031537 RepID=UPI0011C0720B|nr:AsmA-like C-terminal domain-containing protein [Bremerella cremea]
MKRYFSATYRFLKWATFAVVILACALGIYLYHNLNNEIRSYVEKKFASHYDNLLVSVRSARFVEGKGIEIRGFTLSQRSSVYRTQEMVSVDEIMVYCTTNPMEFVSGEFKVDRIVVKRPRLTATLDADGQMNLRHLFPGPKWGDDNPDVEVQDASFLLADRHGGNVRRLLDDVDFQIKTEVLTGAGNQAGQNRIHKHIKAVLSSQNWEAAALTATVDEESQSFSTQGTISNLRIDDHLWQQFPEELREKVKDLTHLSGMANAAFQASGSVSGPINYLATIDLREGSWSDPRIPNTIERIQGRVIASPPGVRVEKMVAYYENGSVSASMDRKGWAQNSPIHISATLKNFNLHKGLKVLLPLSMQETWKRYQPSGVLDASLNLDFDGQRWVPEIHANCRGTNFVFEEFPYPVTEARGKIDFKDRLLEVDLLAKAGKSRVSIVGSVMDPGPYSSGPVRIRTLDPISWDPTFEFALRTCHEGVYNVACDFHLQGQANVDFAIVTHSDPNVKSDKTLRMEVINASVKYDKFKYPISDINGLITWQDDVVTIEQLTGMNDSGHVTCRGTWREIPGSKQGDLNLSFTCKDVPLDDELKDALPPAAQEGWEQLRPRGSIDHMDVQLHWPNPQGDCDLWVNAQKWERSRNLSGRAISVEPVGFPYVLDDVVGSVEFRNGQITLKQLTARHGGVRVSTNGSCYFPEDRRWQIRFQDLRIENIVIDRDLMVALPAKLEKSLQQLQIGPLFHANGEVVLSNPNPGGSIQMNWNVTAHMAGGQIRRGSHVSNIYGEIRFEGQSDETGARSFGEYMLDSVTCRGIPVSNVRGPFWIDETQFLMGRHVPRNGNEPARNVTGNTFGGVVNLDSRMLLAGVQPFQVDVTLANGTVGQMLIDLGQQNRAQTSGRLYGNISMNGTMESEYTYEGKGSLQLRDANLYQLPLAVAMLKVLNARFPNTNAFDTADVNYRLSGNYVYLDDIRLTGDALSIKGNGEAKLDGQISMQFTTEFGNQSFDLPVVRTVLGEASRSLMVIHVGGTVDNPTTEQEIFPLVNETLEQLFPAKSVRLPIGAPPLPESPAGVRRGNSIPR